MRVLLSAIASSAVLKMEQEIRQRVEEEIKMIRDASLREVEEGANRVLTLKAHLIDVKSQLHRQVRVSMAGLAPWYLLIRVGR